MNEFSSQCPYCKQPISDDEALLCHFCGESLGRTSSSVLGKVKGQNVKWLFIIITLIVIFSFLIFMRIV